MVDYGAPLPIDMTTYSNNNTSEYLRITLLSLEGIQLSKVSGSSEGEEQQSYSTTHNSSSNGSNSCQIITAHAGFRTTTTATTTANSLSLLRPEAISIFSSQLNTINSSGYNDCLLVVGSEETKIAIVDETETATNANDGTCTVAVHWRECVQRSITINDHTRMGDERVDTINNTETIHEQQQQQQQEQAKEENFVVDEEETFVPHVEVKLPTYSSFEHQQQLEDGAQEDVIEFHICVVCTTSSSSSIMNDNSQHNVNSYAADDFVIEDDHDSVSIEEHCHRQDTQQHVCHGIAKWNLSPSEMMIAMSGSQKSSTLSSGYDRPRGKVVLLPIHQQIPDNINSDDKQEEEVVKLATNAMLSVQIERISKPLSTVAAAATTAINKREQYHTIESREWRAPASIDSFEGENNDIKKNQSTFGKLVRKATSTLTMMGPGAASEAVVNAPRPRTSNQSARNTSDANYCTQQPQVEANDDAVKDAAPTKKQQSQDQMVGKVIEAIIEHRCPSSSNTSSPEQQQGRDMPSFSSSVHVKKSTASSKPKQQSQSAVAAGACSNSITKAPSNNNTPPQLQLHERFLCGTSFVTDFGNALQILAAAGHHCDEDHVGLYVVNSDEDSNGYSWENL